MRTGPGRTDDRVTGVIATITGVIATITGITRSVDLGPLSSNQAQPSDFSSARSARIAYLGNGAERQFGAGQLVVEVASGHDCATVHWPSSSSTSNVSRSTRVVSGKPGAIKSSRLSAVTASIRLPTVRCG